MEGLLESWPCYKRGHKFTFIDYERACCCAFKDEEYKAKCCRCGRRLEEDEIEDPMISMITTQRDLYMNTVKSVSPFY